MKTELMLSESKLRERIHTIRGLQVMLDSDLALLYEIETFNLNKSVKRNFERFPEDFMFQLTKEETNVLRFQFGMLNPLIKQRQGQHRKYLPFVFTEQGVAMISGFLNSRMYVHGELT